MTITLTREEAQQVLDALYSMNGTEFLCQAAHHPKKDMHKLGEVCPVAARYMAARETLRARLSAPEPEPVAGYRWEKGRTPPSVTFTTTAQREWQGLTDEERYSLMATTNPLDFARSIEAKLKEKNG
jgi:hypothetical protein